MASMSVLFSNVCTEQRVCSVYYPPMKLWEGNVFSHMCLSVYPSTECSPCDHYPWCIGPLGPPRTWGPASPASENWWQSLVTYSNVFTWGPTPTPSGTDIWWHGHRSMYCWQAGGTHPTGMLSCNTPEAIRAHLTLIHNETKLYRFDSYRLASICMPNYSPPHNISASHFRK